MGRHGDRPSLEMYQTIDPLTKELLNSMFMLLSCLALRLELIDLLRRFHSERRAPRPYSKSILRRTPP